MTVHLITHPEYGTPTYEARCSHPADCGWRQLTNSDRHAHKLSRIHETVPHASPAPAERSHRDGSLITGMLIGAVIVIAALLFVPQARAAHKNAPEYLIHAAHAHSGRAAGPSRSIKRRAWVICHLFTLRRCRAALNVFWCESGLSVHAHNGIYLGIPQEDPDARRTYGWGKTVWRQGRSALKMFHARGWQPWGCTP